MAQLTDIAQEQSTFVITAAFTDEDGAPVVPTSITWSLTDTDSTIINSREDVVVAVPAASISIVLSGDDLQFLAAETAAGSEYVNRWLITEALYNSALGTGLKLKDQAEFKITNLKKVGE